MNFLALVVEQQFLTGKNEFSTVCACSTCHLILPMELYDSIQEPSEDEEDMLE